MKLIRLATDNHARFDANFDTPINIAPKSSWALQHLSLEREFPVFEIGVNNEFVNVKYPVDPGGSGVDWFKSTVTGWLVTPNPDKSPALRYAIVNAPNWKDAFKDIENPNSLEHFDGTGAFKVDGEFSETIDLRTFPVLIGGTDVTGEAQDIYQLAFQNPDAEFGKYRIKGKQLLPLLEYMYNKNLLKEGQQFNENFEKALIYKTLKLEANNKLKWNGDTSYLDLFELSDEDQALFDKLTGEGGKNIPEKFNNLQYLIKVLVNEELNTKL